MFFSLIPPLLCLLWAVCLVALTLCIISKEYRQ